MYSRRHFLRQSALVSLSPFIPAFLPRSLRAAEPGADQRILVMIQLDGGNDGLNTVIPFADEKYADLRKELFIPEKDVLKLDDHVGLHPGMKPVADLVDDGCLAVVQGVGYPNPNRSHFRSMAIWQHARLEESQHDSVGWLGRAADAFHHGGASGPDAIYVGDEAIPVAIRGRRSQAVSLEDETDLQLLAPVDAAGRQTPLTDDLSSFVTRTVDRSFDAAQRFRETEAKAAADSGSYPSSELARKLQLIARLIKLGGGARVYYVSQPGYDTHSAQLNTHSRLLSEFSRGLKAFHDDLRTSGLDDRVATLAFSEFGRRAKENGSAGTDHGAAGPVFLAGRAIRGGLIGSCPSLSDLDNGDLRMATDFRQVYASVLEDWLQTPARDALHGQFEKPELFQS
jgi:uncharacterized protein (DUF1501 family)